MSLLINCSKCQTEKEDSQFHPSRIKAHSNGKVVQCRECTLTANKDWYSRNKATRAISIMQYRKRNPEKWEKYCKEHYWKNRQHNIERKRSYHRSVDGYAIYLYQSIVSRLQHSSSYKGRTVSFTKEEFLMWLFSRTPYVTFFEMWEALLFKQKFSPSVDRIDEEGNYNLDNIQILPTVANIRKFCQSEKGQQHAIKNLKTGGYL